MSALSSLATRTGLNVFIVKGLIPRGAIKQHLIIVRNSGHNTVPIKPSMWSFKYHKNWIHFYTLVTIVPLTVFTTILHIRANPVLSEVPEGYEPRHWEYHKMPIARFMDRYILPLPEEDWEMLINKQAVEAEVKVLKTLLRNVERVQQFYQDHRSRYFRPFHAEKYRRARDEQGYKSFIAEGLDGKHYDMGFDPELNLVPTEGYFPDPVEEK